MNEPIVLTGAPSVGKTTVAGMISAETGAPVVDVGVLLDRELRRHGIEPAHRAEIGPLFIERFSIDRVFNLIRPALVARPATVIDAIRSSRTVDELGTSQYPLRLWHVEMAERQRLALLSARLRAEGVDLPRAKLYMSDYAIWDRDQFKNASMADVVIHNTGVPHELRREVQRHLGQFAPLSRALERTKFTDP